MIISKTVLMILTILLIIAVFVAKVTNLINVEVTVNDNEVKKSDITIKNTTLNNKLEHLIWFLQISDIHISIFQDHTRITELREFCDTTLDVINPKVVIASGDLTDAKTKDHIGSRQYEAEWQYYSSVLKECHVQQKTKWLDVRGNHDNFNVPFIDSKENYYKNYSMQGKKHPKSYMYQLKENGDIYSFIAVDACLDPGPRRPFNFVGILGDSEIEHLNNLVKKSTESGSKNIIWFGHFPTSCILTAGPQDARSVIGGPQEGLVYLCGHLHQLGGIVPNMYTLQKAGFLELELGDWKENRIYRLAAIDHGMFSFVDIRHRVWPAILITNPKHARYVIPYREPVHMMAVSSHIRILAFSVSEILTVKVKIDNGEWTNCDREEGPLYVAKWNPSQYSNGMHKIRVQVRDESGRERIISQPFTFEKNQMPFDILARIVLMTNISTVFQFFFGILIIVCILPLCIFRFLHRLVKEGRMKKPFIKNRFIRGWVQKLWMLSTIDRLFFPLVLYPLYLSFGPWSIGYIIEDYLGIVFAWGIFIRGAYLPGSFTYAYGFLQLLIFQFPLTLILATCVNYRVRQQTENSVKKNSVCKRFIFHLPFLIIITIQMMFAYFFWLAYDTLAFVLSPLRTWSIFLAVLMWLQALTLPDKCTREAAVLWMAKSKTDLNEEVFNDDDIAL